MKIKTLTLILILSIISVSNLLSQPQGEDTKKLTLDDCLAIAAQNNPELKLAIASMSASAADITNSFGEFLPTIGINMNFRRSFRDQSYGMDLPDSLILPNQYTNIKPNYYSLDAGFNFTLFDGFRRSNNYDRAKANYNSIYESSRFTLESVQMQIYRTYVQVILNKQILRIRKENYDLGLKELERVKTRYDAGVTSINFVYSQEAELGNRELDIVRAENDFRIAKSNLLILMGMNPELEIDFDEASLPNNISSDEVNQFQRKYGDFETALAYSMNNRYDIQSLRSSIEAAKNQIDMASATYYPTLSASGGWTWSNYYLQDFSRLGYSFLGLNLSIPLFENFRTNLNIENAKLQLMSKETEIFNKEQTIRQSLKTAMLNLQAAEKQMEITERSLLAAQKNYEFSNERYRIGSSSVSDFFIANNLLVTTQINRINAVYSYFIAQKEVLFAIGLLNN